MFANSGFLRLTSAVALVVLLLWIAPIAALGTETRVDLMFRSIDVLNVDTAVTPQLPYRGEMTFGRIVRLPIGGPPGDYTITVQANNTLTLDPMLIIVNDNNALLAYSDERHRTLEGGAFNLEVTWRLEADFTYFAYILHSDGGSEGTFTVTLAPTTPYFSHP